MVHKHQRPLSLQDLHQAPGNTGWFRDGWYPYVITWLQSLREAFEKTFDLMPSPYSYSWIPGSHLFGPDMLGWKAIKWWSNGICDLKCVVQKECQAFLCQGGSWNPVIFKPFSTFSIFCFFFRISVTQWLKISQYFLLMTNLASKHYSWLTLLIFNYPSAHLSWSVCFFI